MPGYCLELDEYFCLGYGGGRANLVVGLEMLKMALGELPRRLEIPNTSGDLGRYRYHLAPKPLRSVTVIGASDSPERLGALTLVALENLLFFHFTCYMGNVT